MREPSTFALEELSDYQLDQLLQAFGEVEGQIVAPLDGIPRQPRNEPLALSFAQQRLWFLDQLAGPSPTYLIPIAMRLHGPLDTLALRRSLATLIERHDFLRSRFITVDGEPRLELIAPEHTLVMREHDLSHEPGAEARLRQFIDHEAREPFDLATGPLIRVRLLRLAAHGWRRPPRLALQGL